MIFDLEILRVDCVFSNCCLCIQNLIPVTLNFNSVKGTTCKIGDYSRKAVATHTEEEVKSFCSWIVSPE